LLYQLSYVTLYHASHEEGAKVSIFSFFQKNFEKFGLPLFPCMKQLLIDIGNTNTKLAVYSAEERLSSSVLEGFDPAAILREAAASGVEAAIVSAVVDTGDLILELRKIISLVLGFGPDLKLPLKNLYRTPETLGNDRLAAAAGAQAMFPKSDVLCIDAGTCIKYDFVNAAGEYLGGGISPGISMRFKALNAFTGRLPLLSPAPFHKLTGGTTSESILSGVMCGAAAEVDGIIQRYREHCPDLKVVLSGGEAGFLESNLKNSIFACPDIVLSGLHEILKCNAHTS
jgi:type III pantothenate kinase